MGDLFAQVPGAAGNLFSYTQRTSYRSQAHLFLEHCACVVTHGMTARLPMGVKSVKMNKDTLPKIPILVNKKVVHGSTMLVALEHAIIAQARAVEKEVLAAAQTTRKQMVANSSTRDCILTEAPGRSMAILMASWAPGVHLRPWYL